ncbi:S41 family peptidase [Salmonirosea aquatica]|uniref:Tail specific protease domain-containing protein n=1 Tax=Salmonirosea aquatica TaxID=2654236 RepID=A0A7C9F7B8_9BACT|nr:hypothetical protein [Cytophagaceae bacterium SJW1-29]
MKFTQLNPQWVRAIYVLVVLTLLINTTCLSQGNLPMIRATSQNVTIKDGYVIQEGIWNLSPEIKPDVYFSLPSDVKKTITFYTDIDSISFDVEPRRQYDFNILLNDKDTCLTRISTGEKTSVLTRISDSTKFIAPELLAMDFVVFRESLRSEHAGLYRYQDREKLDRLLDSCLLSINKPLTQLDFGKKILFITSAIQDGHTGTNISSLLVNSYLEHVKLFPLYLYFVDQKALISCQNDKHFPVGTEILSINGQPVGQIKRALFRYLPSDGSIETKKAQTLNNNGAFPFLYNWIFGNHESFLVQYKTLTGVIKNISVSAAFATDFECKIKNSTNSTKDLDVQYPKNGTAILTIKTFDQNRIKRSGQDFKHFLDEAFETISEKGIQNLTIDVRGNAGGEDTNGALLYSYIAKSPFKYYSSIQTNSKKFTLADNPLLGWVEPQDSSFKGNVYFLINGLSFSTTSDFCAIAKSNGRGVFIGEETGGGYYGNTSGQTVKVELPNSKIQVIIPKLKYTNDVKKVYFTDRGVMPDYQVIPTVEDLAIGKDVQLQMAIDLANQKY